MINRQNAYIFALLCALASATAADVGEYGLLWSYQTGGNNIGSAYAADIDNDSYREVLAGSDDRLYALEPDGRLLWSYETGGRITAAPGSLDGGNVILFGSEDNRFYALDGNGTLLWTYNTGGKIVSSPLVAKFHGRGDSEIAFGSGDGVLYILDREGERMAGYASLGGIFAPPIQGDVDGDGVPDIVFGSVDHNVYVVSRLKGVIGVYPTHAEISALTLADADGDGRQEILAGSSDGFLYCIKYRWSGSNATYSAVWNASSLGPITGIAAADLDGDNRPEVVASSLNRNLYFYEPNGSLIRAYTAEAAFSHAPKIASLDLNGTIGIVSVTDYGYLRIMDANGTVQRMFYLNASTDAAPLIADLNNDKYPEIIIGSADGVISVFGNVSDADGDNVTDFLESVWKTDPYNNDSDGDGLLDSVDPHPLVPEDTLTDSDLDGLMDSKEKELGTDPFNNDTDGDGLTDSIDPHPLIGEGLLVDSDLDGYPDYEENIRGTDPYNNDTDGDGLGDVKDPHPLQHEDMLRDSDRDNLTDYEENIRGTDPRKNDTDGDGLLDSTDPHPLQTEDMRPIKKEGDSYITYALAGIALLSILALYRTVRKVVREGM